MKLSRLCLFVALSALPTLAVAHPGHALSDATFFEGALHPLTGVDHLLAMVAVGLFASQQANRIQWIMPTAFVFFMLIGALASLSSYCVSGVELMIATSVIMLGLVTALSLQPSTRWSIRWSAAVIGAFALAHGYAHGVEASQGIDAAFLVGMMLTTALLHLSGVAFGLISQRIAAKILMRWTGTGIALSGLAMMIGS